MATSDDSETQALTPLNPKKPVDHMLHRLESFLSLLGFNTSSPVRLLLSLSTFFILAIAAPTASVYLSRRSSVCSEYQIDRFEICALVSEASLAAVSLVCVSMNLCKYGIRKFLFVDPHHGKVERFQEEYARKIQDFFRSLLWWMLPCFIIKTTLEMNRAVCIFHDSVWRSITVLLASVFSWVYVTVIFLSACVLFNLVFNLQVIHFDDYGKLLERGSDTLVFLEEHVRLRYNLSKISHRFRMFLVLLFLFISTSQCVTLFQTTGHRDIVNFANAGNLAVSSIVQVVGVVLCLHSAAKITHRAQGVSSVASTWLALITCSSNDSSQPQGTNEQENLEVVPSSSVALDFSESDLESLNNVTLHTDTQIASQMSSFQKRQALVMYLQSNPGGITIFGWVVDRGLITTIFFIELSLILFVLGDKYKQWACQNLKWRAGIFEFFSTTGETTLL